MNKYEQLDTLYNNSRLLYIEDRLSEEEILILTFAEFKEIIDKKAISVTKYNIEQFFDYMISDYVFLSKPLKSDILKADKFITLDIYPGYQIFVYHFRDISPNCELKTRNDFLNVVNNNTLSNQELKIILLHLYYTVYPMYIHKQVSVRNELEIFNKYIIIEKFIDDELLYKFNGEPDIDNTFVVFDSIRRHE